MSMTNAAGQPSDSPPGTLALESLARICKSLGHPVRLQIIAFLLADKQCFCGQIVSRLPLAQSTVSQHLKCLKDAGLIVGKVDGPGNCYCLNREVLKYFKTSLGQLIG